MKILIIINDAPYSTEKAHNVLRMAMMLQKEHAETIEVRTFLMADAVTCALPNQSTPQGYYNIGSMLRSVFSKGGQVKACGIKGLGLIEGVEISTMSLLTPVDRRVRPSGDFLEGKSHIKGTQPEIRQGD